MRILQVIDSVHPGQGGPLAFALQAAAELGRCGDHVEIVAFADPAEAPWMDRAPCPVHGMGGSQGRFGYSARGARWLRENLRGFDAVVVHGIWRHSALAASRAARELHRAFFIYPHGALDRSLPRLYPVRHAKKLAYWHLAGRSLVEGADGVCFTSAHEASRATAYPGRFRAVVTGAGVEPPPPRDEEQVRRLRERLPALRDARVILFMGRLDPIKGLDVLLRALRGMEASGNVALLVAGRGTGAHMEELRALADALAPRVKVAWAGLLTGAEKWAAFHLAEIFAMPSRQESFGVAAVEALAASTPVLASDRVGIADVIAAYGAGATFPLDEASVAGAIAQWLAGPRQGAARNALRCYEENFTAAAAATRLRLEIEAAVRNAPAGPVARSSE